jgi:tetratricopeptide (TPR) repeat protein
LTNNGLRVLILAAAASLLLQPAFSQRGGTPARSSSTSIYYSGHVVLEDGSVPKDKVIIESICSGRVRQETNVDSRGGFGFTLGGSSGDVMLDSSNASSRAGTGADSGNVAECVVRAALPGYNSDMVYLARIERTKPDLGTIVLRKAAPASAPPPASITSAKAPKDARKAFEKAVEAFQNNKADEAMKQFQKAVEVYPAYAEAWYLLAKLQTASSQADAARKSLETAVKADEKYIPPALDLARLEYAAQNWKAVAEITGRIVKNAPAGAGAIAEIPQSYQLHAIASARLGDGAAAEKSVRAGQEADVLHKVPKLWQMLGTVLIDRGDYAGAADNLRKYLEYAPMASDAAKTREVIAECEKRTAAAQPKP